MRFPFARALRAALVLYGPFVVALTIGAPAPARGQQGSLPPTVDVLVVYRDAMLASTTHQAIAQEAAAQVAAVNGLFERSGADAALNLVGVHGIFTSPSSTMAQAVVSANSPGIPGLSAIREQFAADIVVLVTTGVPGCYGSPGLPAHDLRQADDTYVSVSNAWCGFAHAIGRSLGMGSFPGSSDAARPYAFGFVAFPPDPTGFAAGTFMSGDFGGTAAGRLSDPTAVVSGLTIGDPATADARRAIDEAAPLVASYRGCTHQTTGPLTVTADPDGSEHPFVVTTDAGCATGIPDNLPSWLSVVDAASVYQRGSSTVTLRAARNTEFARRTAQVTVGTTTITIRQDPADLGSCPTISFRPTPLSVSGDADSVAFEYQAPFGCVVVRRIDSVDPFGNPVTTYSDSGLRGYGDIWVPGQLWIEPNPLMLPRTETIELSGEPLVVEQGPASCRLSRYSSGGIWAQAEGTGHTYRIDVPPFCAWQITGVPSWVQFSGPMSGAGESSLNVTVAANMGDPRLAAFQIVTTDEVTTLYASQRGATCNPAFPDFGGAIPATGGEVAVTIEYGAAEQGCHWTIEGLPSWLSASTLSGQGTSSVVFTATPNAGPAREALFSFARNVAGFTQAAPACTHTLSGLASPLPSSGQVIVVDVDTQDGCTWSPPSYAPSWLAVPFPRQTTGDGNFVVVVQPNTGYDRSGPFGIEGAGAVVTTVEQVGVLGPSNTTGCATLALSATTLTADPQTLRATVRQLTTCAWSVTTDVPWLTPLPPYPQVFDAEFDVGVAPNLTPVPRTGTISVGGQTLVVTQAAVLGCRYLPSAMTALVAGDGTASFSLATDPACSWTVPQSTVPWLEVHDAGAQRFGYGVVTMVAQPNMSSVPRSTSFIIRGREVVVSQAGNPACGVEVTSDRLYVPMEGGAVTVGVSTPAGCTWETTGLPTGATIVGPSGGTGPGSVTIMLAPNTNLYQVTDHVYVDGRSVFFWKAPFVPYAPTRRYLAEGAVSGFFDTTIALFNPYEVVIDATLSFLRSGHAPVTTTMTLAPRARADVRPATLFGAQGAEFSTVIDTPAPIAIDRTMQWDGSGYGSHTEAAIVSPSLTWYLAEGATGGDFNLFYLLQNPATDAATVKVTYLRGGGLPPLEKFYSVPAQSRQNIWVDVETFATDNGQEPLLTSAEVSGVIEVQNGVPLIVERAMYLDRGGQLFGAGHNSAGVTAPATSWFLAEGATGPYFDMFVLLANPSDEAAMVTVDYLRVDGAPLQKAYVVPARSRFNIWVDQEQFDGLGDVLADAAFSMALASTNGVPIIVERSMWWPGTSLTWHEAHNSPGATATGTRWAIAGGDHRPAEGRETYLLVANASAVPARVEARFAFGNGFSRYETLVVPPKSRANIPVPVVTQPGADRFGVVVESVDNGQGAVAQIVVEMAQYRDVGGNRWQAGGNALATRLP